MVGVWLRRRLWYLRLMCRGCGLAEHRGHAVLNGWAEVDVGDLEAGVVVSLRVSAAHRLQNTGAGPLHERLLQLLLQLFLQLVAKLQVERRLGGEEAVVLSSGLRSIMINNIVGRDALVLIP